MVEFAPVLTKKDFVRRYAAGEFGNAAPTWDNARDYLLSDYPGLVHVRNRKAGGPTWYDVPRNNFDLTWESVIRSGVSPDNLYISAMAPTNKTLLQGEVMQTHNGLYLHATTTPLPMRPALKESSFNRSGLLAKVMLETLLCPNSWSWLNTLIKRYPDHVIEFSTYSTCWGTIPGFNTVFWEVRKY